jgi:hypothetical protein
MVRPLPDTPGPGGERIHDAIWRIGEAVAALPIVRPSGPESGEPRTHRPHGRHGFFRDLDQPHTLPLASCSANRASVRRVAPEVERKPA